MVTVRLPRCCLLSGTTGNFTCRQAALPAATACDFGRPSCHAVALDWLIAKGLRCCV
jgi:hypothetical protein